MWEEIEKKLSYEWESFLLECMTQSKAGILSRCYEISVKKQLLQNFRRHHISDKHLCQKLLALDNILDSAYFYVSNNLSDKIGPDESFEDWETLIKSIR